MTNGGNECLDNVRDNNMTEREMSMAPPAVPTPQTATVVGVTQPSPIPRVGELQVPKASGRSRKVILAPGHSPLDWARLTSSGRDLRVSFRV